MLDEAPAFEPVQRLPDGLDRDVAWWCEMGEARAVADACAAAAGVPGNPTGATTATVGGAVVSALTVIDFGYFNRVIGLGIAAPATRADVAAAVAFYDGLGLQQAAIHVANGAAPDQLPDWVAEAGFVLGGRWVKMWHDLRRIDAVSADRRIERIGAEDREAYGDIVMAAFEMPEPVRDFAAATVGRTGWVHYLGYEGDTPVAAGAMRVDEDVAWLGYGATLEGHRGRGWQTSMFLRRLHDARDRGCRLAVTETGEENDKNPVNPSYRNMVRTGFRLAYARRNWYRG